MSKRSIEVKEKELIGKLNDAVSGKKEPYEAPQVRWDNNGPIQFEDDRYSAGMDFAREGSDKTVISTYHNVRDPKTGRFVKVEGPGVDDTPSDYDNEKVVNGWETPREWKKIHEGEVRINLDPTANIGDEWDEILKTKLTDEAKDWITRDSSQDAKESRSAKFDECNAQKYLRQVREDIELKRLKKNPTKISAMKKALDEYKDTQPRTLNTEGYEYVNHPQHYNNYDMEVIEMMEKIFGRQATKSFCLLNAFKYRMRAGTKPNIPAEQDLAKEQWYLNKAKELS